MMDCGSHTQVFRATARRTEAHMHAAGRGPSDQAEFGSAVSAWLAALTIDFHPAARIE